MDEEVVQVKHIKKYETASKVPKIKKITESKPKIKKVGVKK